MTRDAGSSLLVDPIGRRSLLKGTAISVAAIGLTRALSACSGSPAENTGGGDAPAPPSTPTGTLRPVGFDIGPMDPANHGAAGDTYAASVYGGLLARTPSGENVPWLAEDYSSNTEATEWEFKLRQGVKFHDGEDFDAVAFKKSVEHFYDIESGYASLLPQDGVEIDVSDPAVVRIVSKAPLPDLARGLPFMHVYSPRLLAEGSDAPMRKMVGTGPFKFVKYTKGQSLALEANPDFWGDAPYVEAVDYRVIEDPSAQVAALRSGGADLVWKISPEQVGQLKSSDFRLIQSDVMAGTYLVFLQRDGLGVSNLQLRQAIAHAIDRKTLAEKLLLDTAAPLDSYLPAGVYGAITPETTYDYDPDLARDLVNESGLSGDDLSFTIFATDVLTVRGELVSDAIAQMLDDVGVSAKVDKPDISEASKLYDDVPKWQSIVGDLRWFTGAPTFVTVHYLDQLFAGYKSPEYIALADKVNTSADGPEREQALAELQEVVARDVPIVPLYQNKYSTAVRSNVYGWENPRDALTINFSKIYLS